MQRWHGVTSAVEDTSLLREATTAHAVSGGLPSPPDSNPQRRLAVPLPRAATAAPVSPSVADAASFKAPAVELSEKAIEKKFAAALERTLFCSPLRRTNDDEVAAWFTASFGQVEEVVRLRSYFTKGSETHAVVVVLTTASAARAAVGRHTLPGQAKNFDVKVADERTAKTVARSLAGNTSAAPKEAATGATPAKAADTKPKKEGPSAAAGAPSSAEEAAHIAQLVSFISTHGGADGVAIQTMGCACARPASLKSQKVRDICLSRPDVFVVTMRDAMSWVCLARDGGDAAPAGVAPKPPQKTQPKPQPQPQPQQQHPPWLGVDFRTDVDASGRPRFTPLEGGGRSVVQTQRVVNGMIVTRFIAA